MRRKQQHIVNGAIIVGGATILFDVLLQWLEHYLKDEKFTWKNYDGMRTLTNGLMGGALGAGIGYLVYEYKISEEAKLPFNSDEYLYRILTSENLKADPVLFQNVLNHREEVKQWLMNSFGNSLATKPEDAGSFYKRTAVASNYDLDIILPFKRDSYPTLKEMYNDVLSNIGEKFGGNAVVTKNTKAIGLTFNNLGNEIHFDIVPGREINNYRNDKDLNLYVRPELIWQRGSSFKTNIGIQKTITVNQPEVRSIIKLIKIYRNRNQFTLPTLIIEQCVVEALSSSKYGIHKSVTENLLNSIDYIATKLNQMSIIDYANANNNLNDKISEYQKSLTANRLLKDMQAIEKNPRYAKEIFEI